MSKDKHLAEARRWLAQAREDLEAARVLLRGERYAQACFYCQQSGEKALKALGWLRGVDLWGHSLIRLRQDLKELGFDLPVEERDLATLDRFYIPTRYPNSLPGVIPQEVYLAEDAERGIEAATRIIGLAAQQLA